MPIHKTKVKYFHMKHILCYAMSQSFPKAKVIVPKHPSGLLRKSITYYDRTL